MLFFVQQLIRSTAAPSSFSLVSTATLTSNSAVFSLQPTVTRMNTACVCARQNRLERCKMSLYFKHTVIMCMFRSKNKFTFSQRKVQISTEPGGHDFNTEETPVVVLQYQSANSFIHPPPSLWSLQVVDKRHNRWRLEINLLVHLRREQYFRCIWANYLKEKPMVSFCTICTF